MCIRDRPEALEAGTLNTPGIAGLAAGIAWVQSLGLERIRQREAQLTRYFHQRVQEIPGVELYGDFSAPERLPIVTLNLPGLEASLVSGLLAQEGICTRSGGHCAPLLHRALGTEERGAVRFSFSHVNTEAEIDVAVEALQRIAPVSYTHLYIEQIFVNGDDRKYVTALVVPKFAWFVQYFKENDISFDESKVVFQGEGADLTCIEVGEDFISNPVLQEMIAAEIEELSLIHI